MLQTIKPASTSTPRPIPKVMRAIRSSGYGGPEVLDVIEVPTPEPGPDQLLIRVHASAATTADTMMRAGVPRFARLFLGLRRPKNPMIGTGFSGEVAAAGERVRNFAVGDRVYGESGLSFGPTPSTSVLPRTASSRRSPPGSRTPRRRRLPTAR